MGQYSKYRVYQKMIRRGDEWSEVVPHEYKAVMIEENSVDCGYIDYSGEQLTLIARTSGTIEYHGASIRYATEKYEWGWNFNDSRTRFTINVTAGDEIALANDNEFTNTKMQPNSFSASTASFDVKGNIMSLFYYEDEFSGKTSFMGSGYTLDGFFANSNVVDASNLLLPATTLKEGCYRGMFANCASFVGAPQIQATTLAEYCCDKMFSGCTSLTSAPQLPATTLANYCYKWMFADCTSLTNAPQLPAAIMRIECYRGMFQGCTSLRNAPALPSTSLSLRCYEDMFSGCTSLRNAPALPSTSVTDFCYSAMFEDCTSLVIAPDLMATMLYSGCYYRMFNGCSNLNYIKMLGTGFGSSSAVNYLQDWVEGVSSSGTFVKNSSATLPTGVNGIPNGWTVQDA